MSGESKTTRPIRLELKQTKPSNHRKKSLNENWNTKENRTAASPKKQLDLNGQIEIRAYEIWQAEGHGHGRELEHWLRAEGELAGSNHAITG